MMALQEMDPHWSYGKGWVWLGWTGHDPLRFGGEMAGREMENGHGTNQKH